MDIRNCKKIKGSQLVSCKEKDKEKTLMYNRSSFCRLRQVLFAKRVPVKQEVKPPVAVWLEQTVR